MAVYNKFFIVSLLVFDKKIDNKFKMNKSVFGKEHFWEYNGKKVTLEDFNKTHLLVGDKVYSKPFIKISFVNGEIINVYKNTHKEIMDYYKGLVKYIDNPLFL